MIKPVLKRTFTSEDNCKNKDRNINTYDRVLDLDFHGYILSCFVPLKRFLGDFYCESALFHSNIPLKFW